MTHYQMLMEYLRTHLCPFDFQELKSCPLVQERKKNMTIEPITEAELLSLGNAQWLSGSMPGKITVARVVATMRLRINEHKFVELLNELRRGEEGITLSFTDSNPDFSPLPDEMVTVNASWTGWEDTDYRADSLIECLKLAIEFKNAEPNCEHVCPACAGEMSHGKKKSQCSRDRALLCKTCYAKEHPEPSR